MNKRPLVFILIMFTSGIIMGCHIALPQRLPGPAMLILVPVSILMVSCHKKRRDMGGIVTGIFLSLSLIGFGIFRIQFFENDKNDLHLSRHSFLFNRDLRMLGLIIEDPRNTPENIRCQFRLEKIAYDSTIIPIEGKIRLTLPSEMADFRYGDRLVITGKLRHPMGQRNPGGFDYAQYLALQGIYATCTIKDNRQIHLMERDQGNWFYAKIIYPLRQWIINRLEQLNFKHHADFLKGLLLGDKQQVSEDFLDALAKTGTSHILAVSGLHTGFILMIIWLILRTLRLPPILVTIFTIVGLVLFAFITNLKAPVVRSVIMATIFLLGNTIQRRRDNYNTLAAAALLILLFKPLDLFTPGFQLSFGAVFSILYLYPKFTKFLNRIKMMRMMNQITALKYVMGLVLISLAVQIGTLPLTTWYFNLIPLLGIFANVIVVPLIGLILSLTIVSILFSLISTILAEFYTAVNAVLIDFINWFVRFVARLPTSYVYVPRPDFLTICGFMIFIFILTQWPRTRYRNWGFIGLLIIFNIFLWKSIFIQAPGLRIIHFDVGQGDAALIRVSNKKTMLVDAGDSEFGYDYGKQTILPYLRQQGISHLDYVIATHPHNDHIGGLLNLLTAVSIGQVIDNGDSVDSPIYKKYQQLIDSLAIPQYSIQNPQYMQLSPACDVWFFNPVDSLGKTSGIRNSTNNNSIVFKLLYGNTTFLFTGDAERETETRLLYFGDLLQCNVLKVGHHGSATSSTRRFLEFVNPQACVISVGEFNRFNHPSKFTLQRLQQTHSEILRTDQSGAIVWESDGKQVKRVHWK